MRGTSLNHPMVSNEYDQMIKVSESKTFFFFTFHYFSHLPMNRQFGVSENYNYNRTNRTNCYVRENLKKKVIMRICLLVVDARKYQRL